MERPTLEQSIYSYLSTARIILEYTAEDLLNEDSEDEYNGILKFKYIQLLEMLLKIISDIDSLQILIDKCFERSQQPKSVCW